MSVVNPREAARGAPGGPTPLATTPSPLEGGIPLVVNGQIIGAIGVSGVTSEQDAQIAQAGADNLTN